MGARRMRWLWLLLCAALLVGCSGEQSAGEEVWYSALAQLKRSENYTVAEVLTLDGVAQTRLARYADGTARVTDGTTETYYESDETQCFVYLYSEEHKIWVRQELPYTEEVRYAYEQVERLNKLSALIDTHHLTYDPAAGVFRGEGLPIQYLYRGQLHCPDLLEVTVADGRFASVREVCTMDGQTQTEELFFSDYDRTELRLPANVVDSDLLTKEETEDAATH